MKAFENLDEVRKSIDQLDQQMIQLLSERSQYVKQAASFKKNEDAVRAPDRVEAVIQKVRQLAIEYQLNPIVAENVYRAMIASFIEEELHEHQRIQEQPTTQDDSENKDT